MSDKPIIGKRKESYRSAEKKFKGDRELKEQFRALNQAIPARKTKTVMTAEQMKRLHDEYKKVITLLTQRMTALDKRIHIDPEHLAKPLTQNERKKYRNEYNYMEKLRKTLSKDLRVINYAIKEEKYPTVSALYENSRSDSIIYDLSYAKKYGVGMSTRYRITVPGDDGNNIEGFFTKSQRGKSFQERFDELKTQMRGRYGNRAEGFFEGDGRVLIDVLLLDKDYLCDVLFKKSKMLIKGRDDIDVSLIQAEMKKKVTELSQREGLKDYVDEIKVSQCERAIEQLVNNAEQYKVFVEYVHELSKINNIIGINDEMGIRNTSKISKRNSAMSMMAELLGCGKLLAKSTNLRVKDPVTGKIISGTFMEKAEGLDFSSTDPESMEKFSNLSPNSIEGNVGLIKDIANLQILDWICGNADRHVGNMLYKFDDKGRITGLVGIDNDTSFGSGDHCTSLSGIYLDNINIITKETADRIASMNEEEIRIMLYGYDLTSAEVSKAIERFDKLKEKIEVDKEYFKDKPMGYIEDGRIKIVTNDEIGMLSIVGELGKGSPKEPVKGEKQGNKNKNLFGTIRGMCIDGTAAGKYIDDLRTEVYDNCLKVSETSKEVFDDLIRKMDESQRKTYKPSQTFRDIRDALNTCRGVIDTTGGMLMKSDKNEFFRMNEMNLGSIREQLETASGICDVYIEGKDIAKISKKSKKSDAYIRFNLATDSKRFIRETIAAIDAMINKSAKMYEQNDKSREMMVKCNEEKTKIYNNVNEKALRLDPKKALPEKKDTNININTVKSVEKGVIRK